MFRCLPTTYFFSVPDCEIFICALLFNIHQNQPLIFIWVYWTEICIYSDVSSKKKSWLERHKLSSAYSCIKPSVIQQLPQTFHTRSLHMYYSWPTFIEVLTKVSFSFSENAHNSSLTSSGYIKTESQRPSLNFTYPGWPLKLGWRARIITRFVTPSMIILQESKCFIPVILQSIIYSFCFYFCLFFCHCSPCVYKQEVVYRTPSLKMTKKGRMSKNTPTDDWLVCSVVIRSA